MPLDLRLSPSRDAYPAPRHELDESAAEAWMSPCSSPATRDVPPVDATLPSSPPVPPPQPPSLSPSLPVPRPPLLPPPSAVRPLSRSNLRPVDSSAAAVPAIALEARPAESLPVLHAAVKLHPAASPGAEHEFAAWLVEAETLVVPTGACLHGHFSAPCVHVRGVVHGSVTATRGPLILDQGATVHGRVVGHAELVIAGHVRGSRSALAVEARALLQLARTARVRGQVRCAEVAIYEGARVDGAVLPWPA